MKYLFLCLLPLSVWAGTAKDQFVKGYPTEKTAIYEENYGIFQAALEAYKFFYPSVSFSASSTQMDKLGMKSNKTIMIMKATPKGKVFTANADTPYGISRLSLKDGPVVIELPKGPFIGVVGDIHQRWISDMGIPGRDKGEGGKYLIVPPGYKEKIPEGYLVGQAKSYSIFPAFRILPQNGDANAALARLKEIKIYPLSQAYRPEANNYIDLSDKSYDMTSLSLEDNLSYWQELKKVVDTEPLVEDMKGMYSLLARIGIEKGKPFTPDDITKKRLIEAAQTGRAQMLVSAFSSSRKDKMVWKDRKWEWVGLISDNGDFLTESGVFDLEARDRWFAQAILASPAMFSRKEGAGSLYWLGLKDNKGQYLDGSKTYKLTVPGPVPAKLFWSVSVYDNGTRSFLETDQNRAAIRSLFELKNEKLATYELYFGPSAPKGKENQWIKTIPNKGWFAYFRIYGPEKSAFNGSWKPGDFEEVVSKHLMQAEEAKPE